MDALFIIKNLSQFVLKPLWQCAKKSPLLKPIISKMRFKGLGYGISKGDFANLNWQVKSFANSSIPYV